MVKFKGIASAAFAAGALLASVASYAADVNVRLVHVDANPDTGVLYNEIARRYEASHPGVKVEIQYLENESYKKKLTTMLQSQDRPNILYSWGGGSMREQVKAGVLEDLTPAMDAKWRATIMPAGKQDLR